MPDEPTTTETTAAPAQPPAAATAPSAPRATEARPLVTNTIKHGSVVATPQNREGGEVRTIKSSAAPVARSFTEKQAAMLANIDKHGSLTAPGGDAPAPAASEPAKPLAAPATPAAPAVTAAPDPAADMAARHERVLEHNKRLVAELERRKAAPSGDPDERAKALDEIERSLTTDSIGGIRKLIALNAGIKDPASPDVDRIMSGIYAEWTAHELKMQMDPGRRAELGTERNRMMFERDKRDREQAAKTAEVRAAAAAQEQRDAQIVRGLDAHLDTSKHAERYPLLMKHAKLFDHQSPGELVFSAIRHGIAAGEFTPDTPDETLINHYSKAIETHYQDLREQLAGASTSTAAPAQATVSVTDNKAGATETGARTITNANASVAPATPPAAAPPAKTDQSKPKYRNETDRRQQLAAKYFPDN